MQKLVFIIFPLFMSGVLACSGKETTKKPPRRTALQSDFATITSQDKDKKNEPCSTCTGTDVELAPTLQEGKGSLLLDKPNTPPPEPEVHKEPEPETKFQVVPAPSFDMGLLDCSSPGSLGWGLVLFLNLPSKIDENSENPLLYMSTYVEKSEKQIISWKNLSKCRDAIPNLVSAAGGSPDFTEGHFLIPSRVVSGLTVPETRFSAVSFNQKTQSLAATFNSDMKLSESTTILVLNLNPQTSPHAGGPVVSFLQGQGIDVFLEYDSLFYFSSKYAGSSDLLNTWINASKGAWRSPVQKRNAVAGDPDLGKPVIMSYIRSSSGYAIYKNSKKIWPSGAADTCKSTFEAPIFTGGSMFKIGSVRGFESPFATAEKAGFFDGNIASVLVYNRALSDTERFKLEKLSSDKFLIPLAESSVKAPEAECPSQRLMVDATLNIPVQYASWESCIKGDGVDGEFYLEGTWTNEQCSCPVGSEWKETVKRCEMTVQRQHCLRPPAGGVYLTGTWNTFSASCTCPANGRWVDQASTTLGGGSYCVKADEFLGCANSSVTTAFSNPGIWSAGACSCPAGTVWVEAGKRCENIQAKEVCAHPKLDALAGTWTYTAGTPSCACPPGTLWDANQGCALSPERKNCTSPNDTYQGTWMKDTCLCPSPRSIWNGTDCVANPAYTCTSSGGVWDGAACIRVSTESACTSSGGTYQGSTCNCPSRPDYGQLFLDSATHRCSLAVKDATCPVLYTIDLDSGSCHPVDLGPSTFSPAVEGRFPSGAPPSTSPGCPENYYWSSELRLCLLSIVRTYEKCSSGETYNAVTKSCEFMDSTGLTHSSVPVCAAGYSWNTNLGYCVSAAQLSPLCETGWTYDSDMKKCKKTVN